MTSAPGGTRGRWRRTLVAALAAGALAAPGGTPAEGPAFAAAGPGGRWTALALEADGPTAPLRPEWRLMTPGVESAEIAIGRPGVWRGRAVLVRLDPKRLQVRLDRLTREGGTLGAWTLDSARASSTLAVNAGQFEGGRPWGWLVEDGVERQPPGRGPLSMALVVDVDGEAELVPWAEIPLRRFQTPVRWAFQSYPTLLVGGRPPAALLEAGRGVDLEHRDIRLALGTLPDGRLLLALTRFADGTGISLPWGPTVPEAAALMRALGAEAAVLLDGGLSAQMALRGAEGVTTWRGGRRVPLALQVEPR